MAGRLGGHVTIDEKVALRQRPFERELDSSAIFCLRIDSPLSARRSGIEWFLVSLITEREYMPGPSVGEASCHAFGGLAPYLSSYSRNCVWV